MPALQVRDLPQDIYVALQQRAALEHRSMAQQTIVALEEHLYDSPHGKVRIRPREYPWSEGTEEEIRERIERKERLFARIEELNANRKGPRMTSEELVQMVREMREERSEYLYQLSLGNQPGMAEPEEEPTRKEGVR